MKNIFHFFIIILLIILPFIPISSFIIPHNSYLGDETVSLILIVLAAKTILCTILMTLHQSYNSNLNGWLLFSVGLLIMLPMYLEVSYLKLDTTKNFILNRLNNGLTILAIIPLCLFIAKNFLPSNTLIGKTILTILSLVLMYHIWNNISPLINLNNQSSNIMPFLGSITWHTFMTSLIYFIPISIGLVFVCKGKIRKWKYYTVLGLSIIGIVCCLPNILSNKYIFNTIFTSTAAALIPCYWIGIILLTKSAKRLK